MVQKILKRTIISRHILKQFLYWWKGLSLIYLTTDIPPVHSVSKALSDARRSLLHNCYNSCFNPCSLIRQNDSCRTYFIPQWEMKHGLSCIFLRKVKYRFIPRLLHSRIPIPNVQRQNLLKKFRKQLSRNPASTCSNNKYIYVRHYNVIMGSNIMTTSILLLLDWVST